MASGAPNSAMMMQVAGTASLSARITRSLPASAPEFSTASMYLPSSA